MSDLHPNPVDASSSEQQSMPNKRTKKIKFSQEKIKKGCKYVVEWLQECPENSATKHLLLTKQIPACRSKIWKEDAKQLLDNALSALSSQGKIEREKNGKTYRLVSKKRKEPPNATETDRPKKKAKIEDDSDTKPEKKSGATKPALSSNNNNASKTKSKTNNNIRDNSWTSDDESGHPIEEKRFAYGNFDHLQKSYDMHTICLQVFEPKLSLKRKRHALLVGNSNYVKDGVLPAAYKDVCGVAACLRELGFQITLALNLPGRDIQRQLESFFSPDDESSKINFLFYAGHGKENPTKQKFGIVAVNGDTTWLDTQPSIQKDTFILVLDACRPTGRAQTFNMSWVAPSLQQKGYLIEFACSSDHKAFEEADNGSFSKQLIKHLMDDVPLSLMFQRVRTSMAQERTGKGKPVQVPVEYSSLIGEPINLKQMDEIN